MAQHDENGFNGIGAQFGSEQDQGQTAAMQNHAGLLTTTLSNNTGSSNNQTGKCTGENNQGKEDQEQDKFSALQYWYGEGGRDGPWSSLVAMEKIARRDGQVKNRK